MGPDHFALSLHARGTPSANVMASATILFELAILVIGGFGPFALDQLLRRSMRDSKD
jgi:hypothetical protein